MIQGIQPIFFSLLKYSQFTMLSKFQVYSKVIQLYTHTHTYIYMQTLFHILFPYRLLLYMEYSSLCYTTELCCLSISNTVVSVQPILLIYPTSSPVPFDNYRFIMSESTSVNKFICFLYFFFGFHVHVVSCGIHLSLTSLSMIISSIHVAANGVISFFLWYRQHFINGA